MMTLRLFVLALCLKLAEAAVADTHAQCEKWADSGECEANPTYMLVNCATSCSRLETAEAQVAAKVADIKSFYDLEANDLQGNVLKFESLRGKVIVIVNVASFCGYTEPHYRGLVELWSQVKDEAVEILAFPCNQFGDQEPGTVSEIEAFAAAKGVTFRMMEKINVNGPNSHVVYLYIKNQTGLSTITWNFATYFVVDTAGNIESYSGVEPMDLKGTILALLNDEL